MKRVDRLIIAVFIVTCVIFGIYTGSSYMSRDTEGPVITMKKDTIEASKVIFDNLSLQVQCF